MPHRSKMEFLQELKNAGMIEFWWVSMTNNESDMFTKNMGRTEHNKHAARLCRYNKYYNTAQDGESHEQGRVSGVAKHS